MLDLKSKKNLRYLFLDRDGVLNHQIEGYVQSAEAFVWKQGVLEIFPWLASRFERICIVTNQQGIGKGLMTEAQLYDLHQYMLQTIEKAKGRVDGVYFCPHLASENCACRKPKTGLALMAQADFPEINFEQSLLVGDSPSDWAMALSLGMQAVSVHPSRPRPENVPVLAGLATLPAWLKIEG